MDEEQLLNLLMQFDELYENNYKLFKLILITIGVQSICVIVTMVCTLSIWVNERKREKLRYE